MSKPTTVLVLDDVTFIRRTLKALLASEGHRCYEAASLSQALDACRLFKPAVLVLGSVSGGVAHAIETLRADYPTLRVVVCVDDATRGAVLEAVAAGADDFVARPFHSSRLLAAVSGPVAPEPVLMTDYPVIDVEVEVVSPAPTPRFVSMLHPLRNRQPAPRHASMPSRERRTKRHAIFNQT